MLWGPKGFGRGIVCLFALLLFVCWLLALVRQPGAGTGWLAGWLAGQSPLAASKVRWRLMLLVQLLDGIAQLGVVRCCEDRGGLAGCAGCSGGQRERLSAGGWS